MPTLAQRLHRRLSRHPEGWGRGRSKAVRDRDKAARALLGSIATFKGDVAARLGDDLGPHLDDGETLPDHALSLDLAGRRVAAALARLIKAGDAYGLAVVWHVDAQRRRRTWARQELYPRVRDARREIDAIFGHEQGSKIHGLRGRTRRKIEPLRFQARTMVKKLEAQGERADFRRTGGETVDPRGWLRDVRPAYERLEALGSEIDDRDQAVGAAKEARDKELTAFDAAYGKALRYVRSVYDMAGLGPRALRRLRSFEQRRRLDRWAGFRREGRAAKKKQAAEGAVRGKVASLADWLRRRWAAGG